MRWTITSRSKDRVTGNPIPYKDGRPQRIEVIDTEKWGLGPANTSEEVKAIYEGFWNDAPTKPPDAIVEVLDVAEAG